MLGKFAVLLNISSRCFARFLAESGIFRKSRSQPLANHEPITFSEKATDRQDLPLPPRPSEKPKTAC